MTTPRSTEGLRRSAAKRYAETQRKVRKALRDMKRQGIDINPNSVARYAKVARKTIYNHTELLNEIHAASTTPAPRIAPAAAPPPGSETSITAALREQIRTLQRSHKSDVTKLNGEIKRLEQDLAAAHGEIHRLRVLGGATGQSTVPTRQGIS